MTIFGSECTHCSRRVPQPRSGRAGTLREDAAAMPHEPWGFCGESARWALYDTDGHSILALLCERHRTKASVPIPVDAERAAPSAYLLRR